MRGCVCVGERRARNSNLRFKLVYHKAHQWKSMPFHDIRWHETGANACPPIRRFASEAEVGVRWEVGNDQFSTLMNSGQAICDCEQVLKILCFESSRLLVCCPWYHFDNLGVRIFQTKTRGRIFGDKNILKTMAYNLRQKSCVNIQCLQTTSNF